MTHDAARVWCTASDLLTLLRISFGSILGRFGEGVKHFAQTFLHCFRAVSWSFSRGSSLLFGSSALEINNFSIFSSADLDRYNWYKGAYLFVRGGSGYFEAACLFVFLGCVCIGAAYLLLFFG